MSSTINEAAPPQAQFPFTNRDDELRELLASRAPTYHVVDAPAGYGKTHLLKELQTRFSERSWACAYADVRAFVSVEQLARDLLGDLGLNESPALRGKPRPLGAAFARLMKAQTPRGFDVRGLVLLVDIQAGVGDALIADIIEFIYGLQDSLRNEPAFSNRSRQLRAILAGRALAQRVPSHFRKTECRLHPFTYEVVRNSIATYLTDGADGGDPSPVGTIAAHSLALTGGHPQCIARFIIDYSTSGYDPDGFLEEFGDQMRAYTRDAVHTVQHDISHEIYGLLSWLSVFRVFSTRILERLMRKEPALFGGFPDHHTLADTLVATTLLSKRRRLIEDDITRRILALDLRQRITRSEFARRCRHARAIYKSQLLDERDMHNREHWAIEYLFQCLQEHLQEPTSPAQREVLSATFFSVHVPLILRRLKQRGISRDELDAFRETLREDWEFRFVCNYVLRRDSYTDEPYQLLNAMIR